MILDS